MWLQSIIETTRRLQRPHQHGQNHSRGAGTMTFHCREGCIPVQQLQPCKATHSHLLNLWRTEKEGQGIHLHWPLSGFHPKCSESTVLTSAPLQAAPELGRRTGSVIHTQEHSQSIFHRALADQWAKNLDTKWAQSCWENKVLPSPLLLIAQPKLPAATLQQSCSSCTTNHPWKWTASDKASIRIPTKCKEPGREGNKAPA